MISMHSSAHRRSSSNKNVWLRKYFFQHFERRPEIHDPRAIQQVKCGDLVLQLISSSVIQIHRFRQKGSSSRED